MAVTYQQVPITLDPHTPIPADALPSAGLDDADADLVVQLSADYTAETAITIDVSSAAPFVADVTLTAATAPDEPWRIDWDFGDGKMELGADDSDQHHTYPGPGAYEIGAVVMQRGEASFSLSTGVAFDDAGLLV
jgi:hypothetical protein